jgi:hypothetical protein
VSAWLGDAKIGELNMLVNWEFYVAKMKINDEQFPCKKYRLGIYASRQAGK